MPHSSFLLLSVPLVLYAPLYIPLQKHSCERHPLADCIKEIIPLMEGLALAEKNIADLQKEIKRGR